MRDGHNSVGCRSQSRHFGVTFLFACYHLIQQVDLSKLARIYILNKLKLSFAELDTFVKAMSGEKAFWLPWLEWLKFPIHLVVF